MSSPCRIISLGTPCRYFNIFHQCSPLDLLPGTSCMRSVGFLFIGMFYLCNTAHRNSSNVAVLFIVWPVFVCYGNVCCIIRGHHVPYCLFGYNSAIRKILYGSRPKTGIYPIYYYNFHFTFESTFHIHTASTPSTYVL